MVDGDVNHPENDILAMYRRTPFRRYRVIVLRDEIQYSPGDGCLSPSEEERYNPHSQPNILIPKRVIRKKIKYI
jgi:hypothetical protein